MADMYQGFVGLLATEHPFVFQRIQEAVHGSDADLSIVVLISTTQKDGRAETFRVHASLTKAFTDDNPEIAAAFGEVERTLPISETAKPSTETDTLADEIVEHWNKAFGL